MNKILNILIVISIVLLIGGITSHLTIWAVENGLIHQELRPMPVDIVELPEYSEVTDVKFFNLVGHTFIHSDNCTCKIF
jgi:hypothetical protein